MIRFLSLGSGSSGNCYYLSCGETNILIDAGISVRKIKQIFKDFSLNIKDITAVLVTHDHTDHIKAVGNLAEDYGIPVYATQLVHEGINRNYATTTKVTSEHRKNIFKDVSFELGDFVITPFDVPHDSSDCVGYLIHAENQTFCVITDVGHVTESIQKAVNQSTQLILESNHDVEMLMGGPYPAYLKGRILGPRGHLSNVDSARLVAEYASPQLQNLWLCHLSEENNHPELARKTYETVLREYGIVAGKDFCLTILRRTLPSEMYIL